MKRILFLGRGAIAEECLPILRSAEDLDVKVVVSAFCNVSWARPCFFISNEHVNEGKILDAIWHFKVNTIISVQHVWILSPAIINAVRGFAFNLHNAKLPDYKGYNTISHAILNGDDTYTTTIHWMTSKVDMGDIVCEKRVGIYGYDTAWSLYQKTVPAAVKNFREFVNLLSKGKDIPRKSIVGDGRFYKREEIQSLKEIKDVTNFPELDRKAKAFYFPPHKPAYFKVWGVTYYVERGRQ